MITFYLSILFAPQTKLRAQRGFLIPIALALVSVMSGAAQAQPSFVFRLQSTFTMFDTAAATPVMIAAAAQLDMLAEKNSTNWAGYFYSAYAQIRLSLALTDKKERDRRLDAADAALTKADKLLPNSEEVLLLQAYSAKARIAVDGAARWKKYGEIYSGLISKAKKINPENPRIYFMEGMEPFWKPRIWGGGKSKAKPYFRKAKELFDKEDKSDILRPYWGEKANEEFLKQCDQ